MNEDITFKSSTFPETNLFKKNMLTQQYYGYNFTYLIGTNIRCAAKNV